MELTRSRAASAREMDKSLDELAAERKQKRPRDIAIGMEGTGLSPALKLPVAVFVTHAPSVPMSLRTSKRLGELRPRTAPAQLKTHPSLGGRRRRRSGCTDGDWLAARRKSMRWSSAGMNYDVLEEALYV